MSKKRVGVLGGLGPLATVYFMDMVVKLTEAEKDQDHIPMLVMNDASIPDRTAFILGRSPESPLPQMLENAAMLEKAGVDFLVIPCNTAHFFYDAVTEAVQIPVINIMEEAVAAAGRAIPGLRAIGVLATDGTVQTGVYERFAKEAGLELVVPEKEEQEAVMHIIYDEVKAGRPADWKTLVRIGESLRTRGAEAVILGCTELSVVSRDQELTKIYPWMVDSLEALAEKCIVTAGGKLRK